MDGLLYRLAAQSGRERLLTTMAAIALVTYIAYLTAFQSLMGDIGAAQKRITAFNKKSRQVERARGTMPEIAKELARLRENLAEKIEHEKKQKLILEAGGNIGSVLRSMETSASRMNLELLSLDAATSPFAGEKAAITKNDENAGRFTKNIIRLKYRSDYPSAVDYLSKIMGLPYAISLVSVDMARSGQAASDRSLITSTVELEIFSQ